MSLEYEQGDIKFAHVNDMENIQRPEINVALGNFAARITARLDTEKYLSEPYGDDVLDAAE